MFFLLVQKELKDKPSFSVRFFLKTGNESGLLKEKAFLHHSRMRAG